MSRRSNVKMAPKNNREYITLAKKWGFVEVGCSGGHTILDYKGRKVQMTSPQRNMPMPWRALRQAAEILGVEMDVFLRGPKKVKATKVTKPRPVLPSPTIRIPRKVEATEAETLTRLKKRNAPGKNITELPSTWAKRPVKANVGVEVPEFVDWEFLVADDLASKPESSFASEAAEEEFQDVAAKRDLYFQMQLRLPHDSVQAQAIIDWARLTETLFEELFGTDK